MPEVSAGFIIFNGTQEIGRSELEIGDPYQGIRAGHFAPKPGYAALQALYQALTLMQREEGETAEEFATRREKLQNEAAALPLRVQTSDGRVVPTSWVHIEDYAEELGQAEREVTLCVDEYSTYEQFFT